MNPIEAAAPLTITPTPRAPGLSPMWGPAEAASPGPDFASLLGEAAASLRGAESAAFAALSGKAPAQAAVARILEADRTLQTAIAVRDRVVSALQEIGRMQI